MYSDILANNASDAGAVRRSTPSPSVPERMAGEDGEKKPAAGLRVSVWRRVVSPAGASPPAHPKLKNRTPIGQRSGSPREKSSAFVQMSTRDGKARKARVQTLSSGLRVCPDGAKPGRRCLALRVYLSTTDQHKG
ncbi:hypothetical protein MG293_012818 [Ovis ammon polii]|uniref:Uncharacterized protein n=1 Tax=Ovis ammon polii TaxID=230172 RepID=A0AAD4U3Q0_OVIAM|nr:hypothetical protein MG293_012818 [Ovis ammon polii]